MRETIAKVIAIISFIFFCATPISINMAYQSYKFNENQEYRRSIEEYGESKDDYDVTKIKL